MNISEKKLEKFSEFFKAFSDMTRIKILLVLKEEELSVTCIACKLKMEHSAISHQLRVLRNVNLVKRVKRGKEVFYSLSDIHIHNIFEQAIEHINE